MIRVINDFIPKRKLLMPASLTSENVIMEPEMDTTWCYPKDVYQLD